MSDAPAVHYVTTSDGVRIAYTLSGEGPPLVFVTEPVVSHVQLEWSQPIFGLIYRTLARHNTLVRFDVRGTGLSDRTSTSPFEYDLDFQAVVDRLQLDRFALVAVQGPSVGVIGYAADHPERVSRLVVVNGFLRFADFISTPQVSALRAAGQADFVLATEAIGTVAFGPSREESREYGAYIRSCINSDYFLQLRPTGTSEMGDATAAAVRVVVPTLVLRHSGIEFVSLDMSKEVAATIPGAQFTIVPGGWADDPEGLAERISEFVNAGGAAPATSSQRTDATSGMQAILFTDIEGHTNMMQRLGDERGRVVLREHERITRETLRANGGAETKAMGDGFMASFASVNAAAQCAVDLQRAFAVHNETSDEPIAVRIGLNAGEPIAEDDDLFGSSVILAARIAAQAQGGEILVSDVVRGLLSGKGFLFADRGETALRGFEDPVRLYEVRWRP